MLAATGERQREKQEVAASLANAKEISFLQPERRKLNQGVFFSKCAWQSTISYTVECNASWGHHVSANGLSCHKPTNHNNVIIMVKIKNGKISTLG